MDENNLFRQDVINYKKNKNFGGVLINLPITYQYVVGGGVLIVLLLILFGIFAEFSEKLTVQGYINSIPSIITVFPERNGIITQTNLIEGKSVNKNDILYVIDNSTDKISNHSISGIIKNLNKQKIIIEKEINRRKNYLKKLNDLVQKNYFSLADYNQKYDEIINLKINKNAIEQDIIKYTHENSYIIRAPISGVISSIVGKKGEAVAINKPLVKIIPEHFRLSAELFIPVRKINFLNKNNEVYLRYDAFPSEIVGTFGAIIKCINQTILTDSDEKKPLRIGQPYYKVIADLKSPYINWNKEKKFIQPGMTFTGVIMGNKRKVWQWILPTRKEK